MLKTLQWLPILLTSKSKPLIPTKLPFTHTGLYSHWHPLVPSTYQTHSCLRTLHLEWNTNSAANYGQENMDSLTFIISSGITFPLIHYFPATLLFFVVSPTSQALSCFKTFTHAFPLPQPPSYPITQYECHLLTESFSVLIKTVPPFVILSQLPS
jgi:hypothetical protein